MKTTLQTGFADSYNRLKKFQHDLENTRNKILGVTQKEFEQGLKETTERLSTPEGYREYLLKNGYKQEEICNKCGGLFKEDKSIGYARICECFSDKFGNNN